MKTYTFLLAVLSLIFLGTLTTLAIEPIPISQNYQYVAILSGDEAIPPQNTGAFGKAFFGLNQEMNQISYRVEVYNIYDVLMVTLRLGSPGKEGSLIAVSYTHLRAHETVLDLVCRLLLEKKKKQ